MNSTTRSTQKALDDLLNDFSSRYLDGPGTMTLEAQNFLQIWERIHRTFWKSFRLAQTSGESELEIVQRFLKKRKGCMEAALSAMGKPELVRTLQENVQMFDEKFLALVKTEKENLREQLVQVHKRNAVQSAYWQRINK